MQTGPKPYHRYPGLLGFIQDGILGGMIETNRTDRLCGAEKVVELAKLESGSPPAVKPFEPPVMGITFIGTSHGFDANGVPSLTFFWFP